MRFLLVLPILLLAACASSAEVQKSQADSSAAVANARALEATARIKEAEANIALAAKVDATGASNALLLSALKGLGLGQAPQAQVVQAPPQSLLGMAWQSILQIADLGLRGYGIRANRDVSIQTSNNLKDIALSNNAVIGQLGATIGSAATAGYPYIQAPGAVTTNTLSGTGVLGSGSYNAPITTTTTTTTDNHANPTPTVVTCTGTPPVCTR